MLSDKLTVVYATSPHRFGESTCMIDLSIQTLKEYGFKDCKFIICADGVNPKSKYSEQKEKEKYKTYIEKLKLNYNGVDLKVIESKKNIGLTLNYMQAWENMEVETEFVFFMNHDAALTPGFYLLKLEKILEEFPEDAKTLIFARDDTKNWQKWFKPEEHDIKKGEWKNTLKSFGCQDNACITKTEAFPYYVDNFYNPEITNFLEDSMQMRLQNIASQATSSGWEKFGTYVWGEPLTFHIDGQSKADNFKFSEKVWSQGFCYSKNLKKLSEHTKERSELWIAVDTFTREEVNLQGEIIMDNFMDFSTRLLNFSKLHFQLPTDAIRDPIVEEKTFYPQALPKQDKNLQEAFHITENSLKFMWQTNNQTIIAKVVCGGNQIIYGGHQQGLVEIPFDLLPSKESIVELTLESYDEDGFLKERLLKKELNLSTFSITPEYAKVFWRNKPTIELKIFREENKEKKSILTRRLTESECQASVNFRNIGMLYGETLMGYFENKELGYKSWDFYIDAPCGYEYDYSMYQKIELIIKNVHRNLEEIMPDQIPRNITNMLKKFSR